MGVFTQGHAHQRPLEPRALETELLRRIKQENAPPSKGETAEVAQLRLPVWSHSLRAASYCPVGLAA